MKNYSTNSEQAVLATMIEDNEIISRLSFLGEDDFYHQSHKTIYKLITDRYADGLAADLAIMMDVVPDEAGGISYLTDLYNNRPSTKLAVSYGREVLEMSLRRQAIAEYQNAIDELNNGTNYTEQVANTSKSIDESMSRLAVGDTLKVSDMINMSIDEMDRSLQDTRLGISTGIPEIDCRLGYQMLAVGEVTALGALSKNGKTLFANTIIARADLREDECAHVFSVEMPALGMFNGIVSAMSGVPSNFYARQDYYQKSFPSKYTEWMASWGEAAQELNNSNRIEIDGTKSVNMSYIVAEMRKQHQLKANQGKKLRLVVIDHLHRLEFDVSKKSMTYAMGDDVRMLKNTASDLGIAVLILTQLKEDCKDRDPTAYDILDTARVRQEIQCFIGTRIFRENGKTYFGIYSDAHRYADHETQFHAGYMRMAAGVVRTLPDEEKHWTPTSQDK